MGPWRHFPSQCGPCVVLMFMIMLMIMLVMQLRRRPFFLPRTNALAYRDSMRDASFQLLLYTSKIWVYCSSSSKQEQRQWATCKGEFNFVRQSGKHVRESPDEQTGCDIFTILSGSNGPGDLDFDLVSKEVTVNVKQVVGKSRMGHF